MYFKKQLYFFYSQNLKKKTIDIGEEKNQPQ